MKRQQTLLTFSMESMLIVLLMTACATNLPPVKSINDLKSIAGTWQGTFTTNAGTDIPVTLTIREDGTFRSRQANRDAVEGTIGVKDGKAMNSRDGTYTLHGGNGQRILTFSNPRGFGVFSPAK